MSGWLEAKPGTGLPKAPAIASSSMSSMTDCRASSWPHHQVAIFGRRSSSPSNLRQSFGMKLIMAGASSTPEPSALAMTTPPFAQGIDEARHAKPRMGVEFERIGEIAVDAPPDHIGALQPGNGADMDFAVAHRQIAAFDQKQAEIAGEIGLLEIGFVERARASEGRCADSSAAPSR